VNNKLIGRVAGGSSVVEVGHDRAIRHVDELIYPPATEVFVAPGFIDLQVNGFAGVDYNDPASTRESISASIRTMFTTGVTRFFATVITGSRERMAGALKNLAAAKEEFRRNAMPEVDAMEAFHVEGPHISPEDGPRGAHPREHVRPPDIDEFKRWQDASGGNVRLVTVAPEWPESPAYIRAITGSGVTVSVGHTRANSDQIRAAVDAGATMSTHLGNGANSILPKTANYIWDQLADDHLTASFVVDGIHIPSAFLKSALRAKGVERSVLVTDAVMPAMCAPGPYQLGQVEVELRSDQSVVLRGGTRLAGSALRMDRAIGNCVRLGGISLGEALAMATVNAARAGRIPGRRGLTPGEKADLVLFEWNEATQMLAIRQTVVAGETVYATLGDTTGTAVHP
jgi:N-acetylglucosamine-6-phosphate deacetylase